MVKKRDPVVETPGSQLIWIQSALVDSYLNFHEDIAKDNQDKAKNVIFGWLPPWGVVKSRGPELEPQELWYIYIQSALIYLQLNFHGD